MTFVTKQDAGLLKSARRWGVLGLLLALVVVLGSWDVISQTSPISLNTGLVGTAGSTLIAIGSPDDNWGVAVGTGSFNPAIVVDNPPWPAPFPNSRWISVNADKNVRAPARTPITYRFTFTLPTGVISPQLSMQLRADDIIRQVRLNGTQIFNDTDPNAAAGAGKPGSHLGPPLVINHSANFQPGPNQLDVVVEDVQAIITGLDVAGTVTYRVAEERVNLAITKRALNAPWQVNGTGAFTLLVQNLGPGTVPAGTVITVTDPIPAGLTVTSAGGPGWTCNPVPPTPPLPRPGPVTISCTHTVPAVGLPPTSSLPLITIAVNVTQAPPVPPGVFRNCAGVRGTLAGAVLPETSFTDNESCVDVPVVSEPTKKCDLVIGKSPTRGTTTPLTTGQQVTFEIVVTNQGNGPCDPPIQVTETFTAGLTLQSAGPLPWTPAFTSPPLPIPGAATVTYNYPLALQPTQSVLLLFTFTITAPPPNVVGNCVDVKNPNDTNLANNRACIELPVVESKPAQLCIEKFDDRNGNGIHNVGPEPLLFGWTFIIKDVTGATVATITIAPNKNCVDLKPGTYTVSEVVQSGWTPTAPPGGTTTVTLVSGQTLALKFGNKKCCLNFTFLAGRPDNFSTSLPADPLPNPPPGVPPSTYPGAQTPASFDGRNEDQWFGHRFILPPGNCIEAATLQIRAKPLGSSDNDNLILRSGSQQWVAHFRAGTGSVGIPLQPGPPWNSASVAAGVTFTLQLGSLPPGTGSPMNLIPSLHLSRSLDVIVQDDTSVDYIRLVVRYCECAKKKWPIDLSLTNTLDGQLISGQNAVYLISITNEGIDSTKQPIRAISILPDSLGFVEASGDANWSCSAEGQTVNCVTKDSLESEESFVLVLIVNVKAKEGTEITNCAVVSSEEDADPENNRACDTAAVQGGGQ